MAAKSLLEQLRAKRKDYDEEVEWHRFLLDTICGAGGYKGRVGPAAVSVLGWAAEAYATLTSQMFTNPDGTARMNTRTYLDQFPREDEPKFQSRIDVAHFVNYTAPIHETLLAYINKEEMNRDGLPDAVSDWMQDVDGHGQDWDLLMHEVVNQRASGLGWCPMLIDMPRLPGEYDGKELSAARAKELGQKPRAIPLYPMNVLDWRTDESGEITAIKLRTCHEERDDLLAEPVKKEVYSIWYPDRCERYTVTLGSGAEDKVEGPEVVTHSYGRVPVVIFRAKPASEDKVRGSSIIGDIATVNRRIFNLDSELDDFLRNSCFAILGVPVFDSNTNVGEIMAGNGSAMAIPQEAKQGLHYVAPPESVPAAIETRREVLVREIYRIARVEFQKPTGVTTSGIARAYEFEQTNRRLTEIAQSFARGEEEALTLVASMLGNDGTDLTVTSPTDFSVEDLASDLTNLKGVIDLGVGATATTELKRRLVHSMLQNVPTNVSEAIDDELDELQKQDAQDADLEREVNRAQLEQAKDPELAPAPGAPLIEA